MWSQVFAVGNINKSAAGYSYVELSWAAVFPRLQSMRINNEAGEERGVGCQAGTGHRLSIAD